MTNSHRQHEKYGKYEILAVVLVLLVMLFGMFFLYRHIARDQFSHQASNTVDVSIEMVCLHTLAVRPPEDLGEHEFTQVANRTLASFEVKRQIERSGMNGTVRYTQVAMNPAPMFKLSYAIDGASANNHNKHRPEHVTAVERNSQSRVVMNTFELVPGRETCGDAMLRLQRKLDMSNF